MAELDRNRLPVAALLMLAKLDHDVLSERECAGIGDYGAQQLDPFLVGRHDVAAIQPPSPDRKQSAYR